MPPRRRRILLPLLLLAPLGCTAWYRDATVFSAPIPEREQVQIFTITETIVAHSVRVDSTSLSYVLRFKPPECDSCRVTIPLAAVDSVRIGKLSPARNIVLGLALLIYGMIASQMPTD